MKLAIADNPLEQLSRSLNRGGLSGKVLPFNKVDLLCSQL